MSSYPDPIAINKAQGPSLACLKVKYLEEHGVLPAPELERGLMDKYWEENPPRQEGTVHPLIHSTERATDLAEQPYHQYQLHHQELGHPIEASPEGHLKLVQRRPDLAPFLSPSPTKTHGGPLRAAQRGPNAASVSAPPVMPGQQPEPFFDLAATAPKYGDPFVDNVTPAHNYGPPFFKGAVPVPEYSVPVSHRAARVPDYDTPTPSAASSPTKNSLNMTPEDVYASSTYHPKAAAAAPKPRRTHKSKNPWTQAELDRVVYLREKENKNWVEIQKASHTHTHTKTAHQTDLGTHTTGSIADKYWQIVRLSKGLKK